MLEQWALIIVGAVFLLMGVTNLSSFATRRRMLQKLLGETGTRIMYIVLGIAFIIVGYILNF